MTEEIAMQSETTPTPTLDTTKLEEAVKDMYRAVARTPDAQFHFETGREMAERLGYDPTILDRIPAAAIQSFAGVGHPFGLASLKPGERVLDLGSGSGMDCFVAARYVGVRGDVIGVDMTDAQLDKAARLRDAAGDLTQVRFIESYIEELPLASGFRDAVISNGVINLVADKEAVFREAARVLRPGGRLAISDIVTDVHLPQAVTCNVDLWAACIGGAMHRIDYQEAIAAAGFDIDYVQLNPEYRFLSGRAKGASDKYRVQSISLLASKR
jgi:SAM-dependent methyltransferase